MHSLLKTTLLTAVFVGAIAAVPGPEKVPTVHFGLSKSAPEAGSTPTEVTEIRLWFTEEPQDGTTAIRLIDASEEAIHTEGVTQDPEDARSFFVKLHHALEPGRYTVSWRGMGADGHVVRDTFSFAVAGG